MTSRTRSAWGFAELEQLRREHGLTITRFGKTVGLPVRTYCDRGTRHLAGHNTRGPWPTPARAVITELAPKYPMWGHRKIAWLARHEHGLHVAEATCPRILREAALVLPIDYAPRASRSRWRSRRGVPGAAHAPQPGLADGLLLSSRPSAVARGGRAMSSTTGSSSRSPGGHRGPDTPRRDRLGSRGHRGGRAAPRTFATAGPHRPGHGRAHADLPRLPRRPVLQGRRVRDVHRLPARAHAHPHPQEEPADQRRDRALPRRDRDRAALARAPGRRHRDDRDGLGLPPALQRGPPTRSAQRPAAPRPLPRRPSDHALRPGARHIPNAPNQRIP